MHVYGASSRVISFRHCVCLAASGSRHGRVHGLPCSSHCSRLPTPEEAPNLAHRVTNTPDRASNTAHDAPNDRDLA